ncbi:MAG: SEC-C domain-containing protein [Ruminococcus sp.]|nr:SEC-C domain-containing protein [Ruminococcus sp.]
MLTPSKVKKKVSKNCKCPCGSGKKFRNCCKGKRIYD